MKLLELAEVKVIEKFGPNTSALANVYNNKGMLLKEKGDFNGALSYYLKTKTIRKELLNETHPDVIAIEHNIAQLHYDFGKREESKEMFDRVADLLKQAEKI